MSKQKQDKQGGGWQFPRPLEIIKCKEGNKEYMKERPARKPYGRIVKVCEFSLEAVAEFGDDDARAVWRLAKAGFLLQAVIMPCDVISAQFVQRLQELTRQCAVSLDLREQERERQAAAESAGQFKVDPETGAIIEPESEAGDDD